MTAGRGLVLDEVVRAAVGGHHVPGTSYEWRHGWEPLTLHAAKSHHHGRVPPYWHPPGAGPGEHRVSGTMKHGDWHAGHQAVAPAPVHILGAEHQRFVKVPGRADKQLVRGSYSDPWWMTNGRGGWAVSRRWRNSAQTGYDWSGGGNAETFPIPATDERVLTRVDATGNPLPGQETPGSAADRDLPALHLATADAAAKARATGQRHYITPAGSHWTVSGSRPWGNHFAVDAQGNWQREAGPGYRAYGGYQPNVVKMTGPPGPGEGGLLGDAHPANQQNAHLQRLDTEARAAEAKDEAAHGVYVMALNNARTPGGGYDPQSPKARLAEQLRQEWQAAHSAAAKARMTYQGAVAKSLSGATRAAVAGHHVPGTGYDWRHEWEPLTWDALEYTGAARRGARGLGWGEATRAAFDPGEHPRGPATGRWYHGTNRVYQPGHVIDPSQPHVKNMTGSDDDSAYLTSDPATARTFADIVSGRNPILGKRPGMGGEPHVYEVAPTGPLLPDYRPGTHRTKHPIRVIREVPHPAPAVRGLEWAGTSRRAIVVDKPRRPWDPVRHPRDARGRFTRRPGGSIGSIPAEHHFVSTKAGKLAKGDYIGTWEITGIEHGNKPHTTRVLLKGGARLVLNDNYRVMGTLRHTVETRDDPAIAALVKIHGDRLHLPADGSGGVFGWPDPVQNHLRDLAQVPASHQRWVSRSHYEIYMGEGPVTTLDDLGGLKNEHPPGYSPGATYQDCAALCEYPVYKPGSPHVTNPAMVTPGKIALGDRAGSGSVNTAAHETGHAIDRSIGETIFWRATAGAASIHPDFTAIYEQVMRGIDDHKWAINPYYVQSFGRGDREFFAETYAAWVHTRARAGKTRAEEIMDAVGFVPTAFNSSGSPVAPLPAAMRSAMKAKREAGAALIAYFDGLDARIAKGRKMLPPPRPARGAA
jgi:hypothetical protein